MRPIDADKILSDFPIRYDHCDKENGSEDFVWGIETVMEYIDCIADEHPLDIASVAKKPIRANRAIRENGCVYMLDENEYWKCPNDHGAYDVPLKENQKYCHECGQLIDWGK